MVDRANWLGLATVIFSNLSASERKFATAQCAADALVQSAIFWKVVEESEKQASVVAP